MELFIIRHLPTAYNVRGVLQGRRDIPILPPDTAQMAVIRANRETLGDMGTFDHVLTSTLKRTRMTAAHYVADHRADSLLDELDFGPYEGRPKADLLREQPLWRKRPDQLILGEPLSALGERVGRFLEIYETRGKILVFGHGAWARALLSLVDSGSIRGMNQIRIPNNALVRVRPSKEN